MRELHPRFNLEGVASLLLDERHVGESITALGLPASAETYNYSGVAGGSRTLTSWFTAKCAETATLQSPS